MKDAIPQLSRFDAGKVLTLASAVLLASVPLSVTQAQDVIEASMQIMDSAPDIEPCQYSSDGVDLMPTDCADASVHEQKIDLMLEAAAVESEQEPAEFPDDIEQSQPPAAGAIPSDTPLPSDTLLATPEITATVPADSFVVPEVSTP